MQVRKEQSGEREGRNLHHLSKSRSARAQAADSVETVVMVTPRASLLLGVRRARVWAAQFNLFLGQGLLAVGACSRAVKSFSGGEVAVIASEWEPT